MKIYKQVKFQQYLVTAAKVQYRNSISIKKLGYLQNLTSVGLTISRITH